MAQLLPVVQHPAYEAALLMRLLAEEGVVGSRSASGRAGPVVGRPVRHSGSRPLLVQEIREHWGSEIQPTCLLRWSRQAGLTPEELQQQLQQAYQQLGLLSEVGLADMLGVGNSDAVMDCIAWRG
ncbi:hypothetical protein OEZ86_005127 [Tetradesmus obliquus]|nr:hypothetical protein OEZ86_005127 [Tetradesmus obliquus]